MTNRITAPPISETDLDALRVCRLEAFRLALLSRICLHELPPDEPFEPVATAGHTFYCVAALRSRLPILGLRLCVGGALRGSAAPVRQCVFPEAAALLPDLIDTDERSIDVGGNSTAMFVLEIELPSELAPGRHPMEIRAESDTHESETRTFSLTVLPAAERVDQPTPSVTFWPHWETFCRHLGLELWSEEFFGRAEPYLRELASCGMNVVMAPLCADPLRYPLPPEFGCFNRFPSLVEWRRERNGTWSFDYTRFDRCVEWHARLGIDREIECHGLLPCKEQHPVLHWIDAATGRQERREYRFEEEDFRQIWQCFLVDFAAHCRTRGWLERLTFCPGDEPAEPERFRQAAALVRDAIPGIRITAAITAQRACHLSDVLDIATIHLAAGYDRESCRILRDKGVELRWYNCCSPDWGNTLFCCDLTECYRIGFITAANEFAGYLRWSVFDWPDLLKENPGFYWPTGDTFLLYPGSNGPRLSLRYLALREGMRDANQLKNQCPGATLLADIGLDAPLSGNLRTPGQIRQQMLMDYFSLPSVTEKS